MSEVQPGSRAYPITIYLFLTVLVAVVPVFIFSAILSSRLIETEQSSSERYLVKTADELALAFDQEIVASVRVLESLGRVESLLTNDLPRFHKIMTRVLKTQSSWTNIVLHNVRSEGLMTAQDKYGTPFGPILDPDSIQKVIQTHKPTLGKIVNVAGKNVAPANSPYRFSVRIPVDGATGKLEYILSAIISTDHLQEVVNRFSFNPNEWTRALVTSEKLIAARSRDPEKFVGGPASQSLRELLEVKDSGLEKTHTLEGVEAYSAFRRAPYSGWYAAIAVPSAILQAQADKTKKDLILIAMIVFLFISFASVFFSRWISKPIIQGSAAAAALSRGEIPKMEPSWITEIEGMRQSLISAEELLRSRARAKDEFLANMSHELRTPLGIVLGMTELLSQGSMSYDEKQKGWEIVKRNGRQLLRLIDDILDLSKVEARKLDFEFVDFSLPDLISSVAEDFSARAGEKGLLLRTLIKDGAPNIINSDPVRVRQIISNLVGNAIKFTHKGSIFVTLHEVVDDMYRITIADTGIGLTEDQQTLLFKEFTQVDSSHTRKFGGTGLGLSLSRKLSRLLSGDVKLVQSRSGEGSLFEISFKGKALTGANHEPQVPATLGNETSAKRAKLKILLAEDSPDNVALIKNYLRSLEADVVVAANGMEAISLIDKSIDIVLMDIQMPGMDGFEATKEIRNRGYRTPIVAITAHALPEHKASALAGGFTDFVTKPLQRQTLLDVIGKNVKS